MLHVVTEQLIVLSGKLPRVVVIQICPVKVIPNTLIKVREK